MAAAGRMLESERLQEREFNQAIADAITAHNGTRAGALAASAMVQPLAARALGTPTRRWPRAETRPTQGAVRTALETLAVHQGLRGSARSARQSHADAERALVTLEHFLSTPPSNPFAGLSLTGQAAPASTAAFTFPAGPVQPPPGGFSFGPQSKKKTRKSPPRKSPPRKSPPKTRKKTKSPPRK